MVRLLRAALFPTWLWVSPLLAPIHISVDYRPAARVRIVRTVARLENCVAWKNPGCLKFRGQLGAHRGPDGYARFETLVHGRRALEAWFDRHGCLSLRESLGVYNSARADYADVVLAAAQLPGDLVIGEGCE